jgi:hypothetical protein
MTHEELLREILQLPLERRKELLEAVARSLQKDLEASAEEIPGADADIERERRLAAVRRLRGILKTSEPPPSDEELKEEYANYLTEKYS